jgi:hypothetical protein
MLLSFVLLRRIVRYMVTNILEKENASMFRAEDPTRKHSVTHNPKTLT